MNTLIKRLLPPGLVITTATYVGWPPPEPLDLGDDFVSAKSVGWRPVDLEAVPVIRLQRDPLSPVLVPASPLRNAGRADSGSNESGEALDGGEADPLSEDDLRRAHRLSGIVSTTGQSWAILNVGIKCEGDCWSLPGSDDSPCELIKIADGVVELRSGNVRAILKTEGSPRLREAGRRTAFKSVAPQTQRSEVAGRAARPSNSRPIPSPLADRTDPSPHSPADTPALDERSPVHEMPDADSDPLPAA